MPESFNILVQRGLRSFLASMFSCILLLAFVVVLFPACDGKKDKGAGAPVERSFPPMPTVPSMITDANESYEYKPRISGTHSSASLILVIRLWSTG